MRTNEYASIECAEILGKCYVMGIRDYLSWHPKVCHSYFVSPLSSEFTPCPSASPSFATHFTYYNYLYVICRNSRRTMSTSVSIITTRSMSFSKRFGYVQRAIGSCMGKTWNPPPQKKREEKLS